MFGTAIDVALSLIFIYLLLALFASAVQEWIADHLKLRSSELYAGVWRLLTTETTVPSNTSPRSLPAMAVSNSTFSTADAFFKAVWGHDLIKGLSQANHGPSYIPSRMFCLALLDVLHDGSNSPAFAAIQSGVDSLPNGAAKGALRALLADAAGDLDKLKTDVAAWFDDAMDRVSGAYKRFAQVTTFLLGLGVAVVFNVSTIQVAEVLWKDPASRQQISGMASAAAQLPSASTTSSNAVAIKVLAGQIDSLPLPIGWAANPFATLYGSNNAGAWPASAQDAIHLAATLLGWLMTGLAVCLGAPFWFDTLQRFVNVRSSGPPPSSVQTQAETT